MSCINRYIVQHRDRRFEVPCGVCQNCKILNTAYYEALCDYELGQYGYGSFFTCTYDDFFITPLLREDKNGLPVATLQRKDFSNFLKSFRRYCDYHNFWNDTSIRKDFKTFYVGEYGGNGQVFDRPHFHALFFGLDYKVLRPFFNKFWKYGICTTDPILNGGIRYVLKYIEKNLKGKLARELYDENNIERPFGFHSIGLGAGLIAQANEENNYTIPAPNNRRIPISMYEMKKQLAERPSEENDFFKVAMRQHGIAFDNFCNDYTKEEISWFSFKQSLLNEQHQIEQLRAQGVPVLDIEDYAPYTEDKLNLLYERALLSDIPF